MHDPFTLSNNAFGTYTCLPKLTLLTNKYIELNGNVSSLNSIITTINTNHNRNMSLLTGSENNLLNSFAMKIVIDCKPMDIDVLKTILDAH